MDGWDEKVTVAKAQIDDNEYHMTAWDFHHQAGPCLVENLDDFTPTTYWGVYVKEFLEKHNK